MLSLNTWYGLSSGALVVKLLSGQCHSTLLTRYVDSTPTSEVTPFTIRYIHHPIMVTYRSRTWSWTNDSHPFCSMSISLSIHQIRIFQTLTLKLQGQCHGCGQRARPYSQPSIIDMLSFCITPIRYKFLRYNYFEIWPWKIKGRGHGWGQRSRSHSSPSIQSMQLLFFHINRTNHSWDMSNRVFDKKKIRSFQRKFGKKNVYNKIPQQSNEVTRRILLSSFVVIGWLSGSHFILQTSNFLFINATAVTLGHRRVTQYIFPDLYFLCPKYLRFSSNDFDVRSKSHCELKT